MQTYYLMMIDNFKFIVHNQNSVLQVTQQNEGSITNIIAIFKASNSFKHWDKMENFKCEIKEILFVNNAFGTDSPYSEKINKFLNNN